MQEYVTALFNRLFSWRARRTAGVLMAKAAYEPLDETESALLEHICKKVPDLAAEKQQYVAFVKNLTLTCEELPFDLSARVDALLEQPAESRHFHATAYATAAAVILLLASVSLVFMYSNDVATSAAPPQLAKIQPVKAAVVPPDAQLVEAMNRACGVLANQDAASAALLLDQAIQKAPTAPYVGEALLKLADLEYNNLQRYERAYNAYDRLNREYPDILATNEEWSKRYNLLSEAKREKYAPLYVLDFARSSKKDAFPIFEKVITTYPDTKLADAAVEGMRDLLKTEMPAIAATDADELEQVKSRCSNPIAIAQIDLILGHHYCNNLNDRERAKAYYNLVASCDHVALAHEAAQALSRMR